jgi:hypothetical protein
MAEDSDSSTKDESSNPRGSGWRPKTPPVQRADFDYPLRPSTPQAPFQPQPASNPFQNSETSPPSGSGSNQSTAQEKSARSSRLYSGVVFWGVVVIGTSGFCVLLGPTAIRQLNHYNHGDHGDWFIRAGAYLGIAAFDGFAVVALARAWLKRSRQAAIDRNGGNVRGEVRGFRERIEQKGSNRHGTLAPDTIWTFRVERYQDGVRLSPIPVEMRGNRFNGFINEGDTVEVLDSWREGETLQTNKIFNVTNQSIVSSEKVRRRFFNVLMMIWTNFIVLVVVSLIVITVPQ